MCTFSARPFFISFALRVPAKWNATRPPAHGVETDDTKRLTLLMSGKYACENFNVINFFSHPAHARESANNEMCGNENNRGARERAVWFSTYDMIICFTTRFRQLILTSKLFIIIIIIIHFKILYLIYIYLKRVALTYYVIYTLLYNKPE